MTGLTKVALAFITVVGLQAQAIQPAADVKRAQAAAERFGSSTVAATNTVTTGTYPPTSTTFGLQSSTRPVSANEYSAIENAIDWDIVAVDRLLLSIALADSDLTLGRWYTEIAVSDHTMDLISPTAAYHLWHVDTGFVKANGQTVFVIAPVSRKGRAEQLAKLLGIDDEVSHSREILVLEKKLLQRAKRLNLSLAKLGDWVTREDEILGQVHVMRAYTTPDFLGAGQKLDSSLSEADQFHLKRVLALLDLCRRTEKQTGH